MNTVPLNGESKQSVKSIACYFPKAEFRQLISEIDKHTRTTVCAVYPSNG